MNRFRCVGVLLLVILAGSQGYSYPGEPEPDLADKLFIIERSRDADYLVYLLNTGSNGRLDKKSPIEIYWVKKSKDNTLEPITRIQKKFGYGIIFIRDTLFADSEWYFRIAAFSDLTFVLKQDGGNNFRVYTSGQKGEIEVEKLYVNFSNKSYWNPKVSYVTLYGRESFSGTTYNETITSEK
jgi:hypothetical protein